MNVLELNAPPAEPVVAEPVCQECGSKKDLVQDCGGLLCLVCVIRPKLWTGESEPE